MTSPGVDARDRLLDSVIASVERRGLGARSLRDLAADSGTSHRMLLHHFGTRAGLLVAIVAEVETRQGALLNDLPEDPAEAVEAVWARVSDPGLYPFERLFFECYARGAQGEPPFDALVPGLVDGWLDQVAQLTGGRRTDHARLGLAVIRGLLLDLVATGDREATDRALAAFTALHPNRDRTPGAAHWVAGAGTG